MALLVLILLDTVCWFGFGTSFYACLHPAGITRRGDVSGICAVFAGLAIMGTLATAIEYLTANLSRNTEVK